VIAFRSVLCATDLSAEADEAIRQADAFARAHQAKLVVFHALPHAMPSAPLFPQFAGGAAEQFVGLERQVLRILSERVAVLTGRVGDEVELMLGAGSAHSAIIESAEDVRADLIVVGGEGPKGAARRSWVRSPSGWCATPTARCGWRGAAAAMGRWSSAPTTRGPRLPRWSSPDTSQPRRECR
jgi:nucleotide-binding universal stress UspA family protein